MDWVNDFGQALGDIGKIATDVLGVYGNVRDQIDAVNGESDDVVAAAAQGTADLPGYNYRPSLSDYGFSPEYKMLAFGGGLLVLVLILKVLK